MTDCTVAMHGAIDWLSDGETVIKVHLSSGSDICRLTFSLQLSNGHVLLTSITGTGCSTGSAIAAFAGVITPAGATELSQRDLLVASVAGVLATSIAGELAAASSPKQGPASFRVAWIDAVSSLTPEVIAEHARIDVVHVED